MAAAVTLVWKQAAAVSRIESKEITCLVFILWAFAAACWFYMTLAVQHHVQRQKATGRGPNIGHPFCHCTWWVQYLLKTLQQSRFQESAVASSKCRLVLLATYACQYILPFPPF